MDYIFGTFLVLQIPLHDLSLKVTKKYQFCRTQYFCYLLITNKIYILSAHKCTTQYPVCECIFNVFNLPIYTKICMIISSFFIIIIFSSNIEAKNFW